jgi:hypothetical protein
LVSGAIKDKDNEFAYPFVQNLCKPLERFLKRGI